MIRIDRHSLSERKMDDMYRLHRVTLLMFIAAVMGLAQDKKAITNEDVLKMVQAGLPESTVLLAIEQGEPRFDTSASALVTLKQKGVAPSLIEAMMRAGTGRPKDTRVPQTSSSPETPARPPGLYVQQEAEWTRLAPLDFQRSARMKSGGGDFGNSTWVLATPKAEVRLHTARPTFYFVENPDVVREREKNPFGSEQQLPVIQIVQIASKAGSREFQLGGRYSGVLNGRAARMSFRPEAVRATDAKRVRPDTILIQTSSELAPGEYFLAFDNPSGVGTFLIDFGIDTSSTTTSSLADGVATVYIYRVGGGFKPSVFVNGEEWLRLPANRRATLKLSPGAYTIQADSTRRRETSLTVEAGKSYYLRYHISLSNQWFDVVESSIAESEFQKASPVEGDLIKNKDRVVAQ
jgi:hypothetical protein